jgi:hypothetical protein
MVLNSSEHEIYKNKIRRNLNFLTLYMYLKNASNVKEFFMTYFGIFYTHPLAKYLGIVLEV